MSSCMQDLYEGGCFYLYVCRSVRVCLHLCVNVECESIKNPGLSVHFVLRTCFVLVGGIFLG